LPCCGTDSRPGLPRAITQQFKNRVHNEQSKDSDSASFPLASGVSFLKIWGIAANGLGLAEVGEIKERQPNPCTKDKLKN
jgi:hypothetical protein